MRYDTALKSASKTHALLEALRFFTGFCLVSHSPGLFQQPAE